MKQSKLYVFSDFDGTITKKDIGDDIFVQFGKFEPLHSQLLNEEIDIFTYWKSIFKTLDVSFTKEKFGEYLKKAEVDDFFFDFANFCKASNIELSVVSDGFDAYIQPILKKENLDWIKVYSNKMHVDENNNYFPEFYGVNESCVCKSASCKRNTILSQTSENALLIYIGDGYSDYCAAAHCDIIFAKNNLATFCNENKIPHYNFKNFSDIMFILKNRILSKKIKIRNQAFLLRKRAFETE